MKRTKLKLDMPKAIRGKGDRSARYFATVKLIADGDEMITWGCLGPGAKMARMGALSDLAQFLREAAEWVEDRKIAYLVATSAARRMK